MTLKITKEHLTKLLAESENRVIALSGKWGTGKSHMWRELKNESKDEKVKSALYVSLFGLSSMDQVKLKIIQSSVPEAEKRSTLWESSKKGWSALTKFLEGVDKRFAALNDIALLAIPFLLNDKVIVLDDIERKHEKLSIDEVMGFIDEYTQQHNTRIVLILNSDELLDKTMWETLREKVIDQEIRLDTTPTEAFNIAQKIVPSIYADRIGKSVEICGITNIRIICKVIKAANKILGSRHKLSNDVLDRVIPSTVYLSAIHYKAIEDGPDFDFVLNIGNSSGWGEELFKKEVERDHDDKRRAKWRLQLREIGIFECDEYEQLVVDFLKSGLFDDATVSKIIYRYVSEVDTMNAITQAREFQLKLFWDHRLTDTELIAEARDLAEKTHLLDALNFTSLYMRVSELHGGKDVANSMIDDWIKAFKEKGSRGFLFENSFGGQILPLIRAEFDAAAAASQNMVTLFDACEHIIRKNGWGNLQRRILNSASAQDFEKEIKSLKIDDLKLFIPQFLKMALEKEVYERDFSRAITRFHEGCRNICAEANSGRLSFLIRTLYTEVNLESELAPVDANIVSESAIEENGLTTVSVLR